MTPPRQPFPLLPNQPTDPNLDVQVRRFMQGAGAILNDLIRGGYIRNVGGQWVIPDPAGANIDWYPLSNAVHFFIG